MTESGLIKGLRLLGVNRAVGYGVLTRLWGMLAGPISILIIASRFSKEQQGYYYTINSLLALQIFFELGLSGVIATFASHEFASLDWGEKGRVTGDPSCQLRLASLLGKSAKWFGVASILLVAGLIPAGLLFFGGGDGAEVGFAWRLPWVLAALGTGMNLMVVPFFAIVMGSGDVVTVNHREMIGGMIGTCISWLVMGSGGGLYAACAVSFGNVIISWSYLARSKPELVKLAWRSIADGRHSAAAPDSLSWRHEIWPLQWRSAITWGAGYFIFQIFTPVLFKFQGAAVAGQMGMTMSACNALLAVCATWITAKSPEFGKFIALRQWRELDRLFFRVFGQSVLIVAAGAVTGWLVIAYLQANYALGHRFLPAGQVALLLGAIVVMVINNCFAVYLRTHKQEPLVLVTICAALMYGTSTLVLGRLYSSLGVVSGFLAITVGFCLPAIFLIWHKCRNVWHR